MELSERLKALGLQRGVSHLTPRRSAPQPNLSPLGGAETPTPFGPAWVIRRPAPHPLPPPPPAPSLLATWAGAPALRTLPASRLRFLDIETSGLMGGAGTYAILVGVGRFAEEGFLVEQVFLRHPAEENALLAWLESRLPADGALVTYNGKAFDLPLLRTRYRLNGWQTPPTDPPIHVDLLPLARRLWRSLLPNATLLSMETHILRTPRAVDDIPGWMIPSLYAEYLRSGDAAPLQAVVYHNAMDVVSLAALYGRAVQALQPAGEGGTTRSVEHLARARLLAEQGRLEEAVLAFQAALDAGLPPERHWDAVLRLAATLKRLGRRAEAATWWHKAAAHGHLEAFEELAKWHEHQRRDFAQALAWTEAALHLLSAPAYRAERLRWQAAFEHRRARLRRRLGIIPQTSF